MIQASAVCSRSNSLTWISPCRAVLFQWIRFMRRPARMAGPSSRAASSGASARARRGCPRRWLPAAASAGAARAAGRRRRDTPCPTVADASKKPNGSPVRMWSGSMRKWPRRGERRPDQPRPLAPAAEADRPARQPARQRRRVVDLEPQLRDAARVAQRVGHAQPVADVAVELADRVARLEVRQPEADQHVRAADDEDGEVEQVEEERQAGRERGDDEDAATMSSSRLADHGPRVPPLVDRRSRRSTP